MHFSTYGFRKIKFIRLMAIFAKKIVSVYYARKQGTRMGYIRWWI